jgi:biotin carboxyl carrier protein
MDGVVTSVMVTKGDQVKGRQLLLEVESTEQEELETA